MHNLARLLAASAVTLLSLQSIALSGELLPRRIATLNARHAAVENPDRDGRARVRLTLDRPAEKVCYRVEFRDITIRGVYVYRDGSEDSNDYSPPFLKLYDEAPTGQSPLRGCVSRGAVSPSQIRALKRNPQRFYVKAFEYDGDEIAGELRRLR